MINAMEQLNELQYLEAGGKGNCKMIMKGVTNISAKNLFLDRTF